MRCKIIIFLCGVTWATNLNLYNELTSDYQIKCSQILTDSQSAQNALSKIQRIKDRINIVGSKLGEMKSICTSSNTFWSTEYKKGVSTILTLMEDLVGFKEADELNGIYQGTSFDVGFASGLTIYVPILTFETTDDPSTDSFIMFGIRSKETETCTRTQASTCTGPNYYFTKAKTAPFMFTRPNIECNNSRIHIDRMVSNVSSSIMDVTNLERGLVGHSCIRDELRSAQCTTLSPLYGYLKSAEQALNFWGNRFDQHISFVQFIRQKLQLSSDNCQLERLAISEERKKLIEFAKHDL